MKCSAVQYSKRERVCFVPRNIQICGAKENGSAATEKPAHGRLLVNKCGAIPYPFLKS